MMFKYHLICPGCKGACEFSQDMASPPPTLNCGDCLMERVEIVRMRIVKVEPEEPDVA